MFLLDTNDVFEFLGRFGKSGKPVRDLSRIRTLLCELSDPQDGLRFIHVAGTNGKGSVCEMLTECLMAEGYRVGTFTSPYIIEYCDRIRINGINIPLHYLRRYTEIVKTAAEKTSYGFEYSQFEITMCIALLYFKERGCDVIVWETGVGGLLDSTNVIEDPLVSVICSVSYDHTAILGGTIEEITRQKCGIIKEGSPCVLSFGNKDITEDIFLRTAICNHSKAVIPNKKELEIISDTLLGCEFIYKGNSYKTSMCGIHQVSNAVTVIEALSAIKYALPVSGSAINKGIENAKIPARTQVISQYPLIILDGSHNPDGFSALSHLIETKTSAPRYILIGMLEEKESAESVRQLCPLADKIITVDTFHPKALSSVKLAEITSAEGVDTTSVSDVAKGITALKGLLRNGGTGIICGSLYLASEILTKHLTEL